MDLVAADRAHLWHPFTQQQGWADEEPLIVERAEGTYLIDVDGRRYLDGVSSLWCNVHGHRHPRIDAAVRDQLDRVAHTTLLGLSHRPGIELARAAGRARAAGPDARLLLGRGLDRRRGRAQDGLPVLAPARRAAAHEVRRACARPTTATRSARCRSAASTCSTRLYRPLLFDTLHGRARRPRRHGARCSPSTTGEVAAVIVEPLVQGAAGMIVHPEGYLRAVRAAVRPPRRPADRRRGRDRLRPHRADVRLRARGRRARPPLPRQGHHRRLPAARGDARPSERVYEAFLGGFEEFRTFFHGHTYTGNPLALRRGARDARRVRARSARSSACSRRSTLLERAARADRRAARGGRGPAPRLHGRHRARREQPLHARIGHQVTLAARRRGAIIRPLGDVVVLMPPLAIADGELRRLVAITAAAIDAATERVGATPT